MQAVTITAVCRYVVLRNADILCRQNDAPCFILSHVLPTLLYTVHSTPPHNSSYTHPSKLAQHHSPQTYPTTPNILTHPRKSDRQHTTSHTRHTNRAT